MKTPKAPKSVKINRGIYETETEKFGLVTVMKNTMTGMWQTIDSENNYMQTYWTKKAALNDLR